MAKRLVKIAKELNVGTKTIVDFLKENGFEIENKPTSKVSDEMHDALLTEFSNSIAVKEKADKLVIGNRVQQEDEPAKTDPFKPAEVEKVVPVEEPAKVEEEKKVEEPVKEEKKVEEEVVVKKAPEPKLKVVGKIDLEEKKPKKKAKAETKKKAEKAPTEKAPAAEKEKAPSSTEKSKEESPSKAIPEETIRAKTPQLAGLKIQGKIDIKKFDKPKKKPEEKKPQQKSDKGPAPQKRKRTRKKVTAQSLLNRNRGGGSRGGTSKGKKTEEIKTVSQKEIEEKIKATMARLSGGGKNKRQKIRRDNRADKREKADAIEQASVETKLKLTEFISASELANLMDVSVSEIITKCMNLGVIISINQRMDAEIIELVAGEFGHEVEFISVGDQDETVEEEEVDDPKDLEPRAPIVTVMGHVDHGKTSLLDYIRSASVAEGEAGGITQHVGAYSVPVNDGMITFLDTPGHEAFTAMRARGAKVTDIVVVIIAADDKIMPQTKEAISHAQAAGVPIVFAINKVDKEGADPTRIKQELSERNILVEEWGGKYQSQDISAKTGLNIDLLLEKIQLEAEILELKANPNKNAVGTVVEASLDKGRGYVTKLLVQAGTLKIGDAMVTGAYAGKIKAMFNDQGKKIKKAGPSTPVAILGLDGAPQAGEKFKVMDKEQEAKAIALKRSQIEREQTNRASKRISLDEIGRRLALGTFKELNLIVKGDVDGSIEALSDSLIKLSQETVQVNVIHKAVGQIAESDVLLASASDAIIIGFQVRPSSGARNLAEKEGVQIKTYSIIYEAIDEIKKAIEGMLDSIKEEKVLGNIEIKETYKISKIGTIAGCYVTEGKVIRDAKVRVIRDGIVVYPTKQGASAELASLKRYKDDVKEVRAGMECGLTVKNFNDIKVGDVIEAYEIIEIKRTLE
ncbi:MAG: translation initiation factor IF-2 [Saprospiraceae bacterium]|nr:translation initiation factor IF-2 [Bacteroidia bacterium]NNE15142.1 translation initiation factor IF-2 [Saprospiraceae bacterium]NNL92979.1 translation initiation factor IF-2 [Saprospiraceae bacterium]